MQTASVDSLLMSPGNLRSKGKRCGGFNRQSKEEVWQFQPAKQGRDAAVSTGKADGWGVGGGGVNKLGSPKL